MSQSPSLAEWHDKIAAWQLSGLSMSAWCRSTGESYDRFVYWRNRLRAAAPLPVGKFLPVTCPVSTITLECRGISVQVTTGFDRYLLRDILSLLNEG